MINYLDSKGNQVEIGDFVFIGFNYEPIENRYDHIGLVRGIEGDIVIVEIENDLNYEHVYSYETLKMDPKDPIIFLKMNPL